ncbi:MAG: hypothetical protein GSR80_000885 [Desulfurococcales archaeon]|nr:hypothetical protein [Desulfurococcales archaeon]
MDGGKAEASDPPEEIPDTDLQLNASMVKERIEPLTRKEALNLPHLQMLENALRRLRETYMELVELEPDLPKPLKGGAVDFYIQFILMRYVYSIGFTAILCRIEAVSALIRAALEYMERALVLDLHPCPRDGLDPSDRVVLLLAGRRVREYVEATGECWKVVDALSMSPRDGASLLEVLEEAGLNPLVARELRKLYRRLSGDIHGEALGRLFLDYLDITNPFLPVIPTSCDEAAKEAEFIAKVIDDFTDFLNILRAIVGIIEDKGLENGKGG